MNCRDLTEVGKSIHVNDVVEDSLKCIKVFLLKKTLYCIICFCLFLLILFLETVFYKNTALCLFHHIDVYSRLGISIHSALLFDRF